MTSDLELLRQYADQADQAAFTELVRRHVDLVYSVALRLVAGDTHLAEDITQSVFTDLARKAAQLSDYAALGGWLYTSTRFAAGKTIDHEQRRRAREQEASAMSDQNTSAETPWEQLRPLLDEAVGQLHDADRDVLVLRFFQGKSFGEVGGVLGLSENTARMRVERALEKLRSHFARNGVTTTAALLATTLGANGATTAPATLAASVAGKSLAGATTGTSGVATGIRALLATEKGVALLIVSIAAVLLLVAFWPTAGNHSPPRKAPAVSSTDSPASAIVPPVPLPPPPPMNISQNLTRAATAAVLLSVAPVAPAQNPLPAAPPPPPTASTAAPAAIAPVAAAASPATVAALVTANNRFALDLYRQFNPSADQNAFFSPYSISTTLAMTWAGASGETANQMAKVLHFSELSGADVAPGFGTIQGSLAQVEARSGVQMDVANSLWPEQDPEHQFLPGYLNQVQTDFSSEVVPVDFKNQSGSVLQQINDWVAGKTNNKIENLLHPEDVSPSTRIVLVNAIYFKGAWAVPFRELGNIDDVFHLANGATKPVVYMHSTFGPPVANAKYADFPNTSIPFQMLSLNYFGNQDVSPPAPVAGGARAGVRGRGRLNFGGDLSFVIILPRAPDGLAALERTLDAAQLTTWFGQLENARVEVYLPKFKLEQRFVLSDTLKAMGMTDAFIPNSADFSGMNGAHDLYISKVIHQTFLDVDEKGTEAAAATAAVIALGGGARPQTPPPVFSADHPFLFLIRDNTTGSILFLGRLASPP